MTRVKHLYLMGVLTTVVVVLVFTGVIEASWLLVFWVGGCATMMFLMMRRPGTDGGDHRDRDNQRGYDDQREQGGHDDRSGTVQDVADDADHDGGDDRSFAKRHP